MTELQWVGREAPFDLVPAVIQGLQEEVLEELL